MDAMWTQCIEHFLAQAHRRSDSADTLKAYRWTLEHLFRLANKSPDQISRADVERFLRTTYATRARERGPATATRNQRLAIIKSFYTYAANYDVERDGVLVPLFIGRMPTHGLRTNKAPRVHRAMSGEEIRRFFSVIPDTPIGRRDRALFLTYFYTARRRCEVLDLKWGDITESVVVDSRGAARQGHVYRFHNKGSHRQETETAELPEPAYEAIVQYLSMTGRLETIGPEEYVFTSFAHRGRAYALTPRRLCNDRAQMIMKKYVKAAGMDAKRLTLHSWRHSSARERHQRGSSVIEIKQLLRHKSLDTTHLYLESLTSSADPGAALLEHAFQGL